MIAIITISIFMFCMVVIVPINRFIIGKPFRKLLNILLPNASFEQRTAPIVLKKIAPIINLTVKIFRISGDSPRWSSTRVRLEAVCSNNEIGIRDFIAIKILAAYTVFLYMVFLTAVEPSVVLLFLGLSVSVMAFFIPDQLLNIKMKKRKWEIYKDIPSTLLSLAVTTDAGLSLNQALEEICGVKKGALSTELKKTLQQISVGIPQKEAFENLAARVKIDEITLFVSVLTQTMEKGSFGITQVLREQANESWIKRKAVAKELAGKASIKLFLPMIGLVLPALMIFLIIPAVFSILRFFEY